MTVRPIVTPTEAARAAAEGRPTTLPVMTPEQARLNEQRLARSRSFPHLLTRPGVDWRPDAARRKHWRPSPVTSMRNPHVRHEASTLGIPPDTLRVALIRIDFANDRAGGASSGTGRFDLTPTDTTVAPIDRPPHDSLFYANHLEALARYYDAQSYGRVVIRGDVWPRNRNGAYSLSDMADLGPWAFSQDIYGAAVRMFRDMFFAADTQSVDLGDRIPWDQYDRFILLHAGSDLQSDIRQDSELDIPSFTIGVVDTDVVIFSDSLNVPIDRAALVPETINQDGFYGAINGVLAHECGHLFFGYADLYDVFTGLPVVGYWSLMDSGNLVGSQVELPDGDIIFATGLLPPSLDPFHRFFTGDALAFQEMAFGDTMLVADSERNPDMRRVFLSSDEYLVFENRAIAPGETVELDQDPTTRVVLGPKTPDRYEYDALLPGPGFVIWHIDASVVPFESALRPEDGFNVNPFRLGVSVVEADGLRDLGDPGSPFLLGSPFDPFYLGNNATLSDSTVPSLRPHIGTWPHVRVNFLDPPGPTMRLAAFRNWQLPGWPVAADFPPGGPLPLAVDADGDRNLEVCWAGGDAGGPDSAAFFAIRSDGSGLFGASYVVANLDRRPRPLMAALPIGDVEVPGQPPTGPAYFAISTYPSNPDPAVEDPADTGGKVWLYDHLGQVRPGWPAVLPSKVMTPPVIAGIFPTASVFVGCADGRVYQIGLDGQVLASSDPPLPGGVSGRLAVDGYGGSGVRIAAAGSLGDVAVFVPGIATTHVPAGPSWPRRVGPGGGFAPDFLWIDFDGNGNPATAGSACGGARTLIVRGEDRLWAFCAAGDPLPGWGYAVGDSLVAGLGAGDPDGDGYAEVLTQSIGSSLAFWNQSGHPSPGWPKRATREGFRTGSPPLVVDVEGDASAEVVGLNASGILAALTRDGKVPAGWPLATGAGATGSMIAADLNRDGALEIVAPDRAVPDSLRFDVNGRFGSFYAYTLPASPTDPTRTSWTMLGGDPGRSSSLPAERTAVASASSPGPLVRGSLKVYPNPARRKPVSFAYQLSEPAEVEFRILDSSGHEVASFTRSGRRADNLEIWEPGAIPAGLYLARLRFKGETSEQAQVVSVGLVR
jgi:M6 family metalloprotease-like protein